MMMKECNEYESYCCCLHCAAPCEAVSISFMPHRIATILLLLACCGHEDEVEELFIYCMSIFIIAAILEEEEITNFTMNDQKKLLRSLLFTTSPFAIPC